jgi:hypothetical protein
VDENQKEESGRNNTSELRDVEEYQKIEQEEVNSWERMKMSVEQLKDSSFIITTALCPDTLSDKIIRA